MGAEIGALRAAGNVAPRWDAVRVAAFVLSKQEGRHWNGGDPAHVCNDTGACPQRRSGGVTMAHVLRIARRIGASPQRVFDAWIDAGIARRWLFATACRPLASVTIDTRVRGSFALIDDRRGPCHPYRREFLQI